MELAVNAVFSGSMSQKKAAQTYGVPQTTISLRLSKLRKKFINVKNNF